VAQKKFLQKKETDFGFRGALEEGQGQCVHEEGAGGAVKMFWKDNLWRWNENRDALWLHKWGPTPNIHTRKVPEAKKATAKMRSRSQMGTGGRGRHMGSNYSASGGKAVPTRSGANWQMVSMQVMLAISLAFLISMWFSSKTKGELVLE
jgi:hypothetical protein